MFIVRDEKDNELIRFKTLDELSKWIVKATDLNFRVYFQIELPISEV